MPITSIRSPDWDSRFATFGYPSSHLIEARGLLGPVTKKPATQEGSGLSNADSIALTALLTLAGTEQCNGTDPSLGEGGGNNAKPAFLIEPQAVDAAKRKTPKAGETSKRRAATDSSSLAGTDQGQTASKQRVNQEKRWKAMFQELVDFHRMHHHTNVPCYKENKRLSLWTETQRKAYRENKLPPEREMYLNGLGFAWTKPTKETKQAVWDLRLSELEEFHRKYGHTDVPYHYKEFPKLGVWTAWQRDSYRKGSLQPDRIAALNQISFDWNKTGSNKKLAEQETWNKRFAQLMEFRKRFGHTSVPQRYRENPSLGLWVRHIRKRHRKSELPQQFVEVLTTVGFVFFPNVGRQNYAALKKEHRRAYSVDEQHRGKKRSHPYSDDADDTSDSDSSDDEMGEQPTDESTAIGCSQNIGGFRGNSHESLPSKTSTLFSS